MVLIKEILPRIHRYFWHTTQLRRGRAYDAMNMEKQCSFKFLRAGELLCVHRSSPAPRLCYYQRGRSTTSSCKKRAVNKILCLIYLYKNTKKALNWTRNYYHCTKGLFLSFADVCLPFGVDTVQDASHGCLKGPVVLQSFGAQFAFRGVPWLYEEHF